jgi:hypothetical protein
MSDFDPDKMIDAMAAFHGLTIEEAYRQGIATHLKAAREIAAPLLALKLDDEAEPAPVFKA